MGLPFEITLAQFILTPDLSIQVGDGGDRVSMMGGGEGLLNLHPIILKRLAITFAYR